MRKLETIEKNTVVFLSPGTFVSEQTERDVPEWDPQRVACDAVTVTERYGAKPYGFYFRRIEGVDDDGKWTALRELKRSPMYYINGTVETRSEVEARADPDESILVSNMRANGIERVVTTRNGYKHVAPFNEGDELVTV